MDDSPIAPLGPKLPDAVLRRRTTLPSKPQAVELTGRRLQLRPYATSDAPELHEISDGRPVTRMAGHSPSYDADELVWRFMPAGPFQNSAELAEYHDQLAALDDVRVFTVVDLARDELLGSTSLVANQPLHLKIEIANVWFTPAVQGAGINAEATTMLIDHLVRIGYQRIEWKCHSANVRSRRAAERLGFRFEGIQDHYYIHKGRRRDTAWYRILADELPSGPDLWRAPRT